VDPTTGMHANTKDVLMHDVCENGYRKVAGKELRYGHTTTGCNVDDGVIQWVSVRAQKCIDAIARLEGKYVKY
jgi:hypothetical protein